MNNCCDGKAINITCVCVRACARACLCLGKWACAYTCTHVALLIKHANFMRHIVTSFVSPLTPPYFSTLSQKWQDFSKKYIVIEHKMCVSIFSTFVLYISSHSKQNSARYCHKCENVIM